MVTIGQKRTRDTVYRKIWQEAYGDIPKDERGISFDIHHIDGDYTNNALENLKAVSVAEHYTIHCRQEDWHEASLIAKRLFISLDEWKELRSKAAKAQWAKLTKEQRSAINKRGANKLTPEQRSEKSRKGRETLKNQGKLAEVGKKISATKQAAKSLKEQGHGN